MKRNKASLLWALFSVCLACLPVVTASQGSEWDLQKYVTGTASTLRVWVSSVDSATGEVVITGMDTGQTTAPFTFSWGDGQTGTGDFSQNHTYQDLSRNYVVKITAYYGGGATDEAELLVFFVAPEVDPQPLPSSLSVTIPDHPITLGSHVAGRTPPSNLTAFDDSFFTVVPRTTAEYVLSAAAAVEQDFVNENHITVDGGFQQAILTEPNAHGAYALWYASPPACVMSDYHIHGAIRWSVFFHEMAHNFQANSPAEFCFGCEAGGNGGEILVESVARIFQAAAACELINDSERYGLGQEISSNIGLSTIDMVKEFRGSYERYLSAGMHFCAWNDPNTSTDEVNDTFCTLATKFYLHAEDQNLGYRVPAKRMMKLLQTFDQEALDKYDPKHDTAAGATFRSTFMVAALSFAFQEDLRQEFRDLNFPISDTDYEELWQKADTDPADFDLNVTPVTLTVPRGTAGTITIGIEPLNGFSHAVDLRYFTSAEIPGVTLQLSDKTVEPGGAATLAVTADSGAQPSSLSLRLRATGEFTAHASDISVTVISAPIIDSASFDGKKTLTILGSEFGSGPRVLINAVDRTARITSASDTAIVLSGKKKKLGLHTGENKIVVIDLAGTSSAEYVLTL